MRTSLHPDGVPDELQTDKVAAAVAEAVWTFDGEPWTAMSVGGTCGAESCTLEVGGTPVGAAGEDLYTFTVADGGVRLEVANLRGLPASLASELDEAARGLLPADRLGGLSMVSVRWLPPPDDGEFILAYRSGGEEGSPGLDVVLDAAGMTVVEQIPVR
jgi:hypothetical protein